jgi:DMATS type aromatic prenyltransferase
MKRVLEHLKEKQQSFAASPLMTFLRDADLSAQERLSVLPRLAPFVMGYEELNWTLQGGEEAPLPQEQIPTDTHYWVLYLKDLQALEPDTSTDFHATLQLLWGEECTQARRALHELVSLALTAGPVRRQVLTLALHAVGYTSLIALDQVVREYEARTDKPLASFRALRPHLQAEAWAAGVVELDLRPELEQEALETIDEVFSLASSTADELLAYALRKVEARREQAPRASSLTFQEFGTDRLQALCEAVGYSAADTRTVQRFFRFMSTPWGTRRIGTTPPWLSDITDDHTPFELSLALEGERPEVRFLIESQSSSTTLRSSWEDGLALNARLHQEFGVPLERFELVKDLFEPTDRAVRFSLWHAFVLKPGGRPEIKVYLNPAAQGAEFASGVIKEALERLGFSKAWRFLCEVGMRRGIKDQILYFSLDLSKEQASRVKIYIAHKDATAEDLEAVMSHAKEYVPGEAQAFCERLQGGKGRLQGARSTLTCLAFTSDDDERPYSVTLHFPLRCYANDDQDSMRRLRSVVEPRSYEVLERAVQALARRPLEAGLGLVQWASMRWQRGHLRTTFYLATEAYGTVAPRVVEPAVVPVDPPSVHVPGPTLGKLNRLTA